MFTWFKTIVSRHPGGRPSLDYRAILTDDSRGELRECAVFERESGCRYAELHVSRQTCNHQWAEKPLFMSTLLSVGRNDLSVSDSTPHGLDELDKHI